MKVDDNPLQQKHKVSLKSIKAKLEKADNEYRNKNQMLDDTELANFKDAIEKYIEKKFYCNTL